jgi:SAM-dependent methyltransferase
MFEESTKTSPADAAPAAALDIQYYVHARAEILPFIPEGCRTLLDIGCGAAEFGALVKKKRGLEVWGVEMSSEAARVAVTKLDRVINEDFLNASGIPDDYFDVVTFNDCLEHFSNPFPPLARARQKLRAGGTLVCSLPNVRYADNLRHLLLEMDWKYEDWGIRDKTHLRFFTRKSMVRTLEEANYRVNQVKGIYPSQYYMNNWKLSLLRIFFSKWMEDMLYQQYVLVATSRSNR